MIVGDVVSRSLDGLGNAVQEAWIIWWPLVLGFLLSGAKWRWSPGRRGSVRVPLSARAWSAPGRGVRQPARADS